MPWPRLQTSKKHLSLCVTVGICWNIGFPDSDPGSQSNLVGDSLQPEIVSQIPSYWRRAPYAWKRNGVIGEVDMYRRKIEQYSTLNMSAFPCPSWEPA